MTFTGTTSYLYIFEHYSTTVTRAKILAIFYIRSDVKLLAVEGK